MEPPVEAALGDRLADVGVLVQERSGPLDVASEERGRDEGGGHHLGGGYACLGVVAMASGAQELLAQVVSADYGIVHLVLPV